MLGSRDIYTAAKFGDLRRIQQCLAAGTDINVPDQEGKTPLSYAVEKGQLSVVELLLAHGADVNLQDNQGAAPIRWAALSKDQKIVAHLLDSGAQIDLPTAAFLGNMTFFEDYFAQGGDVNTWQGSSLLKTVLLYSRNHLSIVKLLIAFGADVNAYNDDDDWGSPLHLAAQCSPKDVVELLLRSGANLEARDKNGETPLHKAVDCGRRQITEFLIEQGSNIEAKDNRGTSPLFLAVNRGDRAIAKFILEHGAEVNEKGTNPRSDDTLLHVAVFNQDRDMVELLLMHGADVNAKSGPFGYTPLYYACDYASLFGMGEIERLLRRYDAHSKMDSWAIPMHVVRDLLRAWGG